MVAKYSDDEFITAWKRLGTPELVSKALGLNLRGVYKRRENIEAKHGIMLDSVTTNGARRPQSKVPKEGYRAITQNITGHVIVGSDLHAWPGDRSIAFDAFIKTIKKLKPSLIVMNGDSFDGARVSRHAPGGYAQLPEVADELSAVQELHGEIENAAPDGCPLVWCAGNHDNRFSSRLAIAAPEFMRVKGFDIADHFESWQFTWSLWINGHTVIKHRHHQGVHSAYQNTLKGGKNVVTGHTHRMGATMFADYNGLRWGIECGTLGEWTTKDDKMSWAEDNPANHSQGFVILTFADDGTLLEPEFCRVMNGKAWFRGKAIA